ncbi:integumentary mucin C.1-like [Pecten maximus]|uniref:integumentary mucin C.1-like n=1 Tax=Pecten maximus TaxID=6579 RepID=UPI001458B8F3|nr:integumentary mucin C.1-like [Pecten maximus]
MTWNEAKVACENLGMALAKVDTLMKQEYIDTYIDTDWSPNVTGELWIGLHKIDIAQPGLTKWSDCTEIGWNNFATAEPSTSTDKLCFALSEDLSWISHVCDTQLQSICESTTGDCTFDTYPEHGCGHTLKSSSESDWDTCLAECLTDTLPTGEECWAVGHWDGYTGDDCWKFHSADDPNICITEMFSYSAINVGIKICFESDIDVSVPPSVPSSFPNTDCFVIYTTTTIDPTTIAISTSPSSTSTAEAAAEETTIMETTTTTTPPTTTLSTTASTGPTTMPTTTKQDTTISNQIATTNGTLPVLGVCSCTCSMINTSLINLQEEIEKLKDLLTVKKSTTSLYKRKFISVKDDRVSSTSIGYVGVTLLILSFGTIIVLDFPVLVNQIKIAFRGHSKHRVSCA